MTRRFTILLGLMSPLLTLFGARRGTSYVEVHEQRLCIRFGFYKDTISLHDVVNVEHSRWPWYGGIGWRVGPRTLGLVGSLDGIMRIKLRQPQKTAAWFLPISYDTLYVSLEEPEEFVQLVGPMLD